MQKAVRSCNTLAVWTDPTWEGLIFEGMARSLEDDRTRLRQQACHGPEPAEGLGWQAGTAKGRPDPAARPGTACRLLETGSQEEVSAQKSGKQSMGTFTQRQRFRNRNCSLLRLRPSLDLLFSERGQTDSFRMRLQSASHLMS